MSDNLDNREEVLFELGRMRCGALALDFDPRYAEVLRGKRVAVVGPSETLIGTGQGEVIDSYDLVVRFNTVIEYLPFSPELSRDIGNRADILYANNEVLTEGIVGQKLISHEKWPEVCERSGLKFIVAVNNDFTYAPFAAPPRWYVEYVKFERFLDEMATGTPFRMLFAVPDTVKRFLNGYVGRTGFIALFDLLLYEVSELYVTGMTFYHKGGHLFLKDRAPELHPMKNHLGESPKDNSPGHNSYLELEMLRLMSDGFAEKLRLDDRLLALLENGRGDRPGRP